MSTRIERLHRCESGMASVEYILAIPVFLVMLLVIMDIGRFRTAILHTVVASRNAAWIKGEGGQCLQFDDLPKLVDDATTLAPLGCTDRPDANSGARFWSDLDQAGGQRLTGTVRGTRPPSAITAKVQLRFDPYDWPDMTFPNPIYEHTAMSRTVYTHEDRALQVGYDREMAARFREGAGSLMPLFPNVFPGAAR